MSSLYTIHAVEDDNGTEHPTEHLWNPAGNDKDAREHGFLHHDGMLLTGVGQEDEPPGAFVALGHGHTWTAIATAADKWMGNCHPTADLGTHTRLPVEQHAVFIRHPHPDHPCGCEWDGQWRVVYVPADEPGAVAVTVMHAPGGAR